MGMPRTPQEQHDYYEQNKDAAVARAKQWKVDNPGSARFHQQSYYQRNRQRLAQKVRERERAIRQAVNDIKASTPCADCGQSYPYFVMDFDHLDGATKEAAIHSMVQRGIALDRILVEIAKCEVVCANCHRMRTQRRITAGDDSGEDPTSV